MRTLFTLSLLTVASAGMLAAQRTPAVPAPLRSAPIANVAYEVTFNRDLAKHRSMAVTMSFDVSGTQPVLLSLPAWTPGAYEITDFAKWVSNFAPTRGGQALEWDKLDYDTWRIRTTGAGPVKVSFDFKADTLDNAMSWARDEFLLFNGTNVFMYPEGQPFSFPATVHISTESDWIVATGMTYGGAKDSYREGNYHDLVDMPFFVGHFDYDSVQVEGITVRLATYPAGSLSGAPRAETWTRIQKMWPPMIQAFGDKPFKNYTIMQIADSSYQGASGLEHQNSHVDVITPLALGNPFLDGLYAHEIFHAWNVKRLRPADLYPYRYDRSQPTTWLWVSEGITDYYADLVLVRAQLVEPSNFFATTTGKIDERGRDGAGGPRGRLAFHLDPPHRRHRVPVLRQGVAGGPDARHPHPRRERQPAVARRRHAQPLPERVQEGPRIHRRGVVGGGQQGGGRQVVRRLQPALRRWPGTISVGFDPAARRDATQPRTARRDPVRCPTAMASASCRRRIRDLRCPRRRQAGRLPRVGRRCHRKHGSTSAPPSGSCMPARPTRRT